MALLSGFFGALAALLAMIGLYGVISYIIAMRRNEIGIRMALGASRQNVVGIVLRQTLVLLAIGVGIGLVLDGCRNQRRTIASLWTATDGSLKPDRRGAFPRSRGVGRKFLARLSSHPLRSHEGASL